ncbi:MAG: PaaI family thioesterase [Deltaproteobacteria bacterium]|nr:PaaI family thioesterase [Deltaproteobacteria bacterium]MBW2052147.1 PaaI family thioesterase [Deltaproteobacteria bacterium]MBW2140563.1 PaaI family thioesterase [Deltaproteobacteria bacterium]MBW2324260.1 PaaI family thioesterase [Deltaproteobacteria bacterium]
MKISADTLKKFSEKKVAFIERMGLGVVESKPRYVKLKAPLEGNENHIGIMYAGALFTLAEVPGGALFATSFDTSKYYPIVKELSIRFRRPATTDVTIEMEMTTEEIERIQAQADENGKADYILEGEIKDASGEVVALSKGIYQIRAVAG